MSPKCNAGMPPPPSPPPPPPPPLPPVQPAAVAVATNRTVQCSPVTVLYGVLFLLALPASLLLLLCPAVLLCFPPASSIQPSLSLRDGDLLSSFFLPGFLLPVAFPSAPDSAAIHPSSRPASKAWLHWKPFRKFPQRRAAVVPPFTAWPPGCGLCLLSWILWRAVDKIPF